VPPTQITIRQLLSRNQNFRRLWIAQLVSFLGDWFNTLAVYDLVSELSGGSGQALALVLVSRFLPTLVFSAAAGVVADRVSRRKILIVSDVLRAVVVLGFLLVRDSSQVGLVYALTALQLSLSAFFQPARDAAVPTITTRAELLPANALSGVSWSAMLTLGAALGGVVTHGLGRNAAFVIDALSYLFSAWMVRGVRIPERRPAAKAAASSPRLTLSTLTGSADIAEGAAYVWRHPVVAWLLSIKLGWGLGGGVLLLLVIFGERVFVPPGGALGVGILYAARGLGSGIGPLLARRLGGDSPQSMRRAILFAFLVAGSFYIGFSYAPNLPVAVIALLGAHIGGSVLWVFSTTLLQLAVPDRFRGRVFAAEWALVTLSMSASSYFTGWAIDLPDMDPRFIARVLGCVFMIPGLLWGLGQIYVAGRLERHLSARSAAEATEGEAKPSAETTELELG
jgi:MFS family permease